MFCIFEMGESLMRETAYNRIFVTSFACRKGLVKVLE